MGNAVAGGRVPGRRRPRRRPHRHPVTLGRGAITRPLLLAFVQRDGAGDRLAAATRCLVAVVLLPTGVAPCLSAAMMIPGVGLWSPVAMAGCVQTAAVLSVAVDRLTVPPMGLTATAAPLPAIVGQGALGTS